MVNPVANGDIAKVAPAEGNMTVDRKRRTPRQFFYKYFLYGQHLVDDEASHFADTNVDSFDAIILERYRKFFAFLIPFVAAQTLWWTLAIRHDFLSLYPTHWEMPVTMILGAIVAGMTAEGGGAIAFPVMTFILHLSPRTGRDFSVMIQSIGMSLAFFSIMFMRLQVEWRAIMYAYFGALPGCLLGFHFLDHLFSASQKKMMFVSIWASFAFALYLLNREKKRSTAPYILHFTVWKALVLVGTGFVGGIFTSFAGSGVDICIFSVITLLFRVSEKTATPSTIIVMAMVSQFCVFWRGAVLQDMDTIAVDYIKVSVPVVVFFAPFGSFMGSHFHRLTLAWFVCILEIAALLGFLATRPPLSLLAASASILAVGFVFFYLLSRRGKALQEHEQSLVITKVVPSTV